MTMSKDTIQFLLGAVFVGIPLATLGWLLGADHGLDKRKEERERFEKLSDGARETIERREALLAQCRDELPAKATAAAYASLEREYDQRYNTLFHGICDRAECQRQWYDSVRERKHGSQSVVVTTGPIGCKQPNEVPWINVESYTLMTCLPADATVKVQTP